MCLENPVLIKSYIGQFLATGYKTIKFINLFKGYRALLTRISNMNSRKKRREHRSSKLKNGEGSKKDFIF